MRKQITLKQIAKELDVSISTVSKSLRNSKEISEETREKVQAFAKLYNYRPNNIALSLKNRKTKTIGVIIPEIVHHFFSNVIKGIENIALDRGYNVIVGLSNESFAKEVINMEMLANGSIDGFILSLSKETLLEQDYHHLSETINQGMPIVMFDRITSDIKCDKVIVNDQSGAQMAVKKLINSGAKKIGIITTKDYVSVGRLRTQGYINALEEAGIQPEASLIVKIDDEFNSEEQMQEIEREIKLLFLNNRGLDGIFAVNEIYAITAMKVARQMGMNIPSDIQVIGFTDGVLSKHAVPSLTTVSQHSQQMGEKCAMLLIDRLENEEEDELYETVIIQTDLIERESTK